MYYFIWNINLFRIKTSDFDLIPKLPFFLLEKVHFVNNYFSRWEASYRGIPVEPHGIDENIEFFIPVLKEIESILWKYGIKLNIQRDEILYNKVKTIPRK